MGHIRNGPCDSDTTHPRQEHAIPDTGIQMPEGTKTNWEIKWDGKTWFMTLPVEDNKVLEAKWEPGLTCVVRIRESGAEHPGASGSRLPSRVAPLSI